LFLQRTRFAITVKQPVSANQQFNAVKTFGLTGGIGMGKSTAADLLQARGIAVIDTDDLARQIVAPGTPALGEILQTFGPQFVDPSGQLKREALATIIFGDAVARAKLEAILHPRITELWKHQLENWREERRAAAVVVIPLLFETKVEAEFDAVVCLACPETTQRERLAARGWSAEHIEQRIAAQWPIAEKMQRAHYIAWTEGTIEILAQQLARIIPEAGIASEGSGK
jgi:dephospho-CoA kinase